MHKGDCFPPEPPGRRDPSESLQVRKGVGSAVTMGTGMETELNGLGYLGEGVTTKPQVRSIWLASADMCYFSSPCL